MNGTVSKKTVGYMYISIILDDCYIFRIYKF